MARQLRALVALVEDQGLIPITHMVAHNSRPVGYGALFWPLLALHTCSAQTYRQAKTSHTEN